MATRTVVCPECAAAVPYGRLSCPACGSLLASVAGAARRLESIRPAPDGETTTAAAVAEPVAPASAPRRRAPVARRTAGRATANGSSPEAAAPEPPAAEPPANEPPAVEPGAPEASLPRTAPSADEVVPATAPADLDDVAEPAPPQVELPPDTAPASDGPSWPAPGGVAPSAPVTTHRTPPVLPDWPAPAASPAPTASPAPAVAALPPHPSRNGPATAGLRPAITTSEPVRAAHTPAGLPPMPAGSWLPPSAAFAPAADGPVAAATTAAAPKTRPGVASLFADLPFDAPEDLPGWLVAVGSGLAVAGFLLPWANVVPGAAGFSGYTDRWGLAVPSHLFVFAAAAGILSMAILPNRLPAWFRVGVLPLALGGLLLGLVWPFVIGHVGSQVGSTIVAMGALVLMVGGLLAVRPRARESKQSGA